MRFPRKHKVTAWLVLAGICLAHIAGVWRLHPTNYFGLSLDDAIYFSSAKALAEGKGYILPSLPGNPPATKYPILYPWLLSWVWRWNPSFPANLSAAVVLNLVFSAFYLVMTFSFLRTLKGLNDSAALIVTAFCAANPIVLLYSGNLVTDLPFAATTLAAIILATRTLEKDSGPMFAAGCGVVAGLGLMLRVLGVPVAAGLCLAIALRAGWRKSTIFIAGVAPCLIAVYWRLLSSAHNKPPFAFGASPCSRSSLNTWLFFTDYLAFYRVDAISNHLFWQYVKTNIKFVVYQLGAYFIELRHFRPTPLAIMVLFILVCVVVLGGLLKQVQIGGWHPAHFALAFYLIPVLIWDYSSPERFLIPFLPLIGAAVWIEGRNLSHEIRIAFQKEETVKGWIAAAVFVLVAATVMLSACVSWRREIRAIADTSERREALLTDKRDAYSWLRDNSPPDTKIIAYEAASAYLYSARQGMQPTILSQAGKDRPDILNSELSCLFSTSDAIGAQYWVFSDDDFRLEWNDAAEQEKSIEAKMESTRKAVFRSPFGHVRIYSVRTGTR